MTQQSDPGAPPSTPRWVKIFGIVVAVVIVLVVVMLLIGGEHGPGRHLSSGAVARQVALVVGGVTSLW